MLPGLRHLGNSAESAPNGRIKEKIWVVSGGNQNAIAEIHQCFGSSCSPLSFEFSQLVFIVAPLATHRIRPEKARTLTRSKVENLPYVFSRASQERRHQSSSRAVTRGSPSLKREDEQCSFCRSRECRRAAGCCPRPLAFSIWSGWNGGNELTSLVLRYELRTSLTSSQPNVLTSTISIRLSGRRASKTMPSRNSRLGVLSRDRRERIRLAEKSTLPLCFEIFGERSGIVKDL